MGHRLRHFREKQKSTKLAIAAASLAFYVLMLILALCARGWHRASLPQVEVTTPKFGNFWEGEDISSTAALPEKLVENGKLFLISEEVVNGEVRTIAREVKDLVLGRVGKGYREILNGPDMLSRVIVTDIALSDGQEVWITGEWSDEEN